MNILRMDCNGHCNEVAGGFALLCIVTAYIGALLLFLSSVIARGSVAPSWPIDEVDSDPQWNMAQYIFVYQRELLADVALTLNSFATFLLFSSVIASLIASFPSYWLSGGAIFIFSLVPIVMSFSWFISQLSRKRGRQQSIFDNYIEADQPNPPRRKFCDPNGDITPLTAREWCLRDVPSLATWPDANKQQRRWLLLRQLYAAALEYALIERYAED